MREAVIVATARTPIGKAYRGAFNNVKSPTLAGHVIRAALEKRMQELSNNLKKTRKPTNSDYLKNQAKYNKSHK